ncbi:MAG: hypothetical protein ACJ73S_21385 [Mycobacteriales bacterium]
MRITRTAAGLAATALLTSAALATTAATAQPAKACTPTWKLVATPTPPGASRMQYTPLGVDVVSSTDVRFPIWAVGGGVNTAWILRWDGSALSTMPPFPVSPLTWTEPGAGSFDSGSDGWVLARDNATAFVSAERWAGGRWTLTPMDVPPDPATRQLIPHDVAALSPTDAWAVGGTYKAGVGVTGGTQALGALVEHWDGTRWSTVANPLAGQPDTTLNVVKALSPTDVWAAGWRGDGNGTFATLVEHWNGTEWTVLPTPPGANRAGIRALSASGPDDVWISGAQGSPDSPTTATALIEHWDGHTWTVADLPDLGNTRVSGLYAAGPNDVWATTEVQGTGVASSFLHWDGHTWTVDPAPGLKAYGLGTYYFGMGGTGHDDVWATGWTYDFGAGNGTPQIAHLSCGRS